MNRRSVALAAVILLASVAVGAVVLGDVDPRGPNGTLEPLWTSDTARDTRGNHHSVGASADGEVVAAPIAVPASPHGHGAEGESGDATRSDNATHEHAGKSFAPGACELVSLERDGSIAWRYQVRPENCSAHALTEPAVADADGDGEREVLFGTTEKAVVVLGPAGAEERRIPLPTYGYGRPTVGNLTAAQGPEIVASDIRGNLVVAEGDRVAWRRSVGGTVYPAPVIADVDADGEPEVLLGSSKTTVAFESDGQIAWRADVPGWTMATGDVDDDPALEAFVSETGALAALDGRNGTVTWRRTFDATPNARAVADGDGDGQQEVYVALNGGRLVALDAATGDTEWEASVPAAGERLTPAPVVGDLTGDGTLEVVGVTNSGGVAVVAAESGRVTATMQKDMHIWTHATLADLDGDGDSEVLIRRGDGRVLALDYAE